MKSGKELQKSGLTCKSTKFGGCLTGYFLKKVIEMSRFFKTKFITQFFIADITEKQRTLGFGNQFALNVIFSLFSGQVLHRFVQIVGSYSQISSIIRHHVMAGIFFAQLLFECPEYVVSGFN